MTEFVRLTAWHALLSLLPLLAGLVVAVVVANLVSDRVDRIVGRLVAILGGLPVIAVWVILPLITGQPLLRVAHLEVALSILVLATVYPAARRVAARRADQQAARAMGVNGWVRALRAGRVRLPGLTGALVRAWMWAVTAVTLAALLDDRAARGLGQAIVEGWRTADLPPMIIATLLVIALVAVGELALRGLSRLVGIQEAQ